MNSSTSVIALRQEAHDFWSNDVNQSARYR